MSKQLAVVHGNQVYDVVLSPGTTADEVMTQLNLPRSCLLTKRDGKQFGQSEPIYGGVQDGEKLFTSPPAEVG